MTLIMGIDPGPEKSGYVFYSNIGGIVRSEITENIYVKDFIRARSEDVIVAIETMVSSYGSVVGKETLESVYQAGIFHECAAAGGKVVVTCPRQSIKTHVTGSPRANDSMVRQALIDRFGVKGTKKNPGPTFGIKSHAWAALAVVAYVLDLRTCGNG